MSLPGAVTQRGTPADSEKGKDAHRDGQTARALMAGGCGETQKAQDSPIDDRHWANDGPDVRLREIHSIFTRVS